MFIAGGIAVHQFSIGKDNFSYLVRMENGLEAIAIDPGSAKKTLEILEGLNIHLKAILITHTHNSHIEGVHELKEKSACLVIGPPGTDFAEIDQDVADGEECSFGPFEFQALATPGHTKDSQCYFFPDFPALFSGDTLLLGGCGRLFDGNVEEMYQSLKKLMTLPPHTRIFCGHDLYEKNLLFALSLEPDHQEIQKRLEAHKSHAITCTTLAEDMLVNPFLRLSDERLHKALGLRGIPTELEVLAELRIRRNQL